MPTNTFFNLTDEKQNKILEAAKKEFLTNSFYDASINRIIKEADISRGAFYMYFENKEDIFLYLIEKYKESFLQSITKDIPRDHCDIFKLSLLIFDYVTSDKIDKECKNILNIMLTKIDMNLINHCINLQNNKVKINTIKKYTNIDNLNISSEEELSYICDIIFSTVIIEMMFVFSGKYKAEIARKNIEIKFKFIKYGILK